MTEVSYIVQNGQKVYFKDTAGRELLTQKQIKLKAGRGISIAEDGTISATGGNGSANGFFINASGELNNLTFDKTPVELNTAIENGNIVIVSANNAKFVLTDVKDGTYLFSYLVVLGEEDCLAQMATISATSDGSNWTEIKTNLVSIKTKVGTDNSIDIGADFSEWSKFDPDSVIIEDMELKEDGELSIKHRNPNYERDGYNNNNQYLCDNVNIDENFVKNNKTDKIIIDNARYQIVDKNLRELIETYQDNLEFSDDFEVLEDGTISLKEVNNG